MSERRGLGEKVKQSGTFLIKRGKEAESQRKTYSKEIQK